MRIRAIWSLAILLCVSMSLAAAQTSKPRETKPKSQPAKQQTTQKQPTQKPTVRCAVSGKVLTNPDKAPRLIYNGRTYYFGCLNCLAEFALNPDPYMNPTKTPQTVSKCGCAGESGDGKASCCCPPKQPATTPPAPAAPEPPVADTKVVCPVAGEEVDIASAVRFVYNGRVYYTCCNSCKNKFMSDPENFAKKAESLSKLQGQPAKMGEE